MKTQLNIGRPTKRQNIAVIDKPAPGNRETTSQVVYWFSKKDYNNGCIGIANQTIAIFKPKNKT